MTTKILQTIPLAQSAALAVDNLDFIHKKKRKSRDFVKQGVKNIVGVSLISATSDFIDF